MAIYKIHKKEREYAQIHNSLIGNPNLSAKAKGILIYLISKPSDWEVRLSDIKKHMKDGETAIRSGIAELEKSGYIRRGLERADNGQFSEWIWDVYEAPVSPENRTKPEDRKFKREEQIPRGIAAPDGENPKQDKPKRDKQYPTNKDSTNIDGSNTDLKHSAGKNPPDAERTPKKKGDLLDGMIYFEKQRQEREKKLGCVLENLYDYPPDIQEIIMAFSRKWKLPPPPKKTRAFAKWIKDAREVKGLLQNTNLTAEEVFTEAYYVWKTPPGWIDEPREYYEGNFRVLDIGSVTKLAWESASAILNGETRRKVRTHTDPDGTVHEIEV